MRARYTQRGMRRDGVIGAAMGEAALSTEFVPSLLLMPSPVPGTLADTRVPAVPVVIPAFLPPIRTLALFLPIFSVTPLAILTRF